MSDLYFINEHIENIQTCNNAISVISDLLIQFHVDSDLNDEIPKTVKSRPNIDGLLAAIGVLANESERSAEWIHDECRRRCGDEYRPAPDRNSVGDQTSHQSG